MKSRHGLISTGVALVVLTGCAAAPTPLVNAKQADAAYVRGDFRSALRGYEAWPGGNGDPHIQTKIGNCAALLGQPELAERAYQRALTLDPDLPEVRYNLAVLYMKRAQSQLIAALPQSGRLPVLQQRIRALMTQLAQATLPPSESASSPTAHENPRP